MKNLYRVTFINQDSGNEQIHYVLAEGMNNVEDSYSDIVKVEPLDVERL